MVKWCGFLKMAWWRDVPKMAQQRNGDMVKEQKVLSNTYKLMFYMPL